MRNEIDERRIEQAYAQPCSPESPTPWYPVPPYRNEGWAIVDGSGELVARFEEKQDCEYACKAVNMLAEWRRNDEERRVISGLLEALESITGEAAFTGLPEEKQQDIYIAIAKARGER